MSYQVLARKWRPRLFREMVGQEHVLKALINALDHNRLHHAYLFTGTRGVGKTTIARILAKCLNCETGVSSEPCDQCSSCTEINEGRFVDLIEVDAASRTKVEDTRDLLENVQYAPTRGRYKVYLIDEVHMLSNSSFNALLKTLEEPPPHVKFLLATTDPQKLPVTVLSRCLQFSLKNMSAERIVGHLQHVLEKEMVPHEEAGLWQLGRAADGSMRDALSLTDQSIAFGNGKITEADVRTMLGTIDQSLVYQVLKGLMAEDGSAILSAIAQLAEHSPDYMGVMAELIAVLHRIAIAQVLPEAIDNSSGDRQQIYDFAQAMASEDVQLYYQTALLGRRDLPLSPDPRSGFEMVMLRMLAFKPQGVAELPTQRLQTKSPAPQIEPQQPVTELQLPVTPQQPPEPAQEISQIQETSAPTEAASAETLPEAPLVEEVPEPVKKPEVETAEPVVDPAPPIGSLSALLDENPVESEIAEKGTAERSHAGAEMSMEEALSSPAKASIVDNVDVIESAETRAVDDTENGNIENIESAENIAAAEKSLDAIKAATSNPVTKFTAAKTQATDNNQSTTSAPVEPLEKQYERSVSLEQFSSDNWLEVYEQIDAGGILQSTVANCAYMGREENTLAFILDEQQSTLYDVEHQRRLADLLSEYFQQPLDVSITTGQPTIETPAKIIIRLQQERQRQAELAIQSDPVVKQLQQTFGAVIVEDSIKPIGE